MSQLAFDMFEPAPSGCINTLHVPPQLRQLTGEEPRREFIRLFEKTAINHNRHEVFRDFVALAAKELDLLRVRTPGNCLDAKIICARYKPKDLENMHQLFNLMIQALEAKLHDFLGAIFMELELGSDRMGQYFSPYSISRLLAEIHIGSDDNPLQGKPFLSLSEPASGSGGMVIAFAEIMLERGMNPQEQLFAQCIDLDSLAADMCFIHLSLLGIPAEVVTGNTLTGEVFLVRRTPFYYLGEWDQRLRMAKMVDAFRELLSV